MTPISLSTQMQTESFQIGVVATTGKSVLFYG